MTYSPPPPIIKNAVIESISLGTEDYGLLSSWLHLDYGDGGQGFGGYVLYNPKSSKHLLRIDVTGHFIYRVMEIAGVTKWKDMVGKTIRVKSNHDKVYEIGHIVKDDWFNPEKEFHDTK